ncbi:MAG: hypothetical protein R3D67_16110 [Hyphomicrobiaceae bacterium]
MIIWRGWGLIVLVITFGCSLIAQLLTDQLLGSAYWNAHAWPFGVAMIVAGGVVWLFSQVLGRGPPRTLVDEQTGERVVVLPRHDLFFVPIKWWAVLLPGIGIGVILFGWTPGSV